MPRIQDLDCTIMYNCSTVFLCVCTNSKRESRLGLSRAEVAYMIYKDQITAVVYYIDG